MRMTDKDEQEYRVLRLLSQAAGPVGSGQLSRMLAASGETLSEATVGRLLRSLDDKGYTKRLGYRGRVLTAAGRKRLEQLERQTQQLHAGFKFINSLKADKLNELLEVLVARRAIERENARLAAEKITDRELAMLREIIERHKRLHREGKIGAAEDVEFHRLIAKASRNRVLLAATDVIRYNGQLSPALHFIRTQVRGTIVEDHERILEALEAGDPAAAEQAMIQHLENVMADVKKYWAKMRSSPS